MGMARPTTGDSIIVSLCITLCVFLDAGVQRSTVAGDFVTWTFETTDMDIAFSVRFQADGDRSEGHVVEPRHRCSCHLGPARGSVSLGCRGTVYLEWDNSYSWLNRKDLHYRVELSFARGKLRGSCVPPPPTAPPSPPSPPLFIDHVLYSFFSLLGSSRQALQHWSRAVSAHGSEQTSASRSLTDVDRQIADVDTEMLSLRAKKESLQRKRENILAQLSTSRDNLAGARAAYRGALWAAIPPKLKGLILSFCGPTTARKLATVSRSFGVEPGMDAAWATAARHWRIAWEQDYERIAAERGIVETETEAGDEAGAGGGDGGAAGRKGRMGHGGADPKAAAVRDAVLWATRRAARG